MNNLVELAIAQPALPDVRDVVAFADQLVVDSPESAELVAELYRDWRLQWDAIEAKRVEMKAPILEAGRRWDAFFKTALDPLRAAYERAGGKLALYEHQQKEARLKTEAAAREAERARQEALAKQAAEVERKALEEKRRLAQEAAQAAMQGNTTAAAELNYQAELAELAGQQDAQLLIEQASQQVPLVLEAPPKTAGISTRETWGAECVDLKELARGVGAGEAPTHAILPNQKWLDQHARSMGDQFRVPGCTAKAKTTIARAQRR